MLSKIKAGFYAFLVALAFITWPLFLTLTCASLVFYIIYRLIREEQKNKKK
jgi:asparagine N-glycosylation enzyme membrane subunit Stt3